MTNSDLFLILTVWLITSLWQLVFGSLILAKVGNKLTDGGWAWGRLSGWIVISLTVWFGGHLSLPINTVNGIRIVEMLLLIAGGMAVVKNRKVILREIGKKKWFVLVEELLFLFGLVWLVWVRGHNSAILDLEKFMDAGFMQGYLRSPTLPAMDMWLAGEKINYYTFGHFMGAVMIQAWGVDLAYAYNLLLGLVMGLTLTLTFSATINLIQNLDTLRSDLHRAKVRPFKLPNQNKTIIGGLVAAMLMGFGGNSHALWYWLKNSSWVGYWYADATRFIYHTIHEFPAYSFVVSDLHGHVWDLPVVLMFIGVLILYVKSFTPGETTSATPGVRIPVVIGVLFGVMAMTNTWDVLIYGMLMGILSILILITTLRSDPKKPFRVGPSSFQNILKSWIVMGVVGIVVALPFAINFVDIGQGIRLVTTRSPLWQLLVLWSGQLLITLVAVLINFRKKNKNIIVWAMALSVVALLIIPELVYVKDIYPEHPRANTMFKLTYQAFVMMTILIGWTIAKIHEIHPRGVHSHSPGVLRLAMKVMGLIIIVAIVGGMMAFPYYAYRDYYGGLKKYQGIDGLAWMARDNQSDYVAIQWMKKNIQGRPVILEAVGESYTQHARFSAFTGLPTVLGWRVHEWLWRGSFEIPGKRTTDVMEVYEHPESEYSKEVIRRYQIKYIVLGNIERADYHINQRAIEKLGKVVFESGSTEIIEL